MLIGSILTYLYMKPPSNSDEAKVKSFIRKGKLVPRGTYPVLKLDSAKFLVDKGIDLVPVEYLRQKYRIVTGEEITLELFTQIAGQLLQRIEYDENGAFVVKGDTDLLRPPDPPKEYPPLPPGWENCEI